MIPTHENRLTSAHYSRMGHEECDRIHIGTLEILERTGVDVHDEKAREILAAGGATEAFKRSDSGGSKHALFP